MRRKTAPDPFHGDVPDDFVQRVFTVMLDVDRHIHRVLTNRPARALRFWRLHRDLFGGGEIPEHIWIGTSVENQEVTYRIRHLRQVPASVRFLSCEPLLGPLALALEGIGACPGRGELGALGCCAPFVPLPTGC